MRPKFIFGDLHMKWPHKKALVWALAELEAEYKHNKNLDIIQAGDLYDFLSFNRFCPTSHYIRSKDEIEDSWFMAKEFWKAVNKIAPKAKKYQLLGNHDIRPLARMKEKSPEHVWFIEQKLKELFTFPGVKTIHDPRKELYLDGIAFYHGHIIGLGKHMMKYHETCVTAHTHKGGTVFHPWGNRIRVELNVGFLADRTAAPMAYMPRSGGNNTTLGYGFIDELGNMTFRHYPGIVT